tara:strand:- start:157 stop:291 length:135 start_codon:yes stop_codon:yes gene_type:complete
VHKNALAKITKDPIVFLELFQRKGKRNNNISKKENEFIKQKISF